MALAQQPSVLLLDEPTTFLDIKHMVQLLDLVTEGSRRVGYAVVMILHDLNLAAAYADRVALLAEGTVLSEGHPRQVLTAENIALAYGIEAVVTQGAGGRPHIVLRTGRSRAKPDRRQDPPDRRRRRGGEPPGRPREPWFPCHFGRGQPG